MAIWFGFYLFQKGLFSQKQRLFDLINFFDFCYLFDYQSITKFNKRLFRGC